MKTDNQISISLLGDVLEQAEPIGATDHNEVEEYVIPGDLYERIQEHFADMVATAARAKN